MFDRVWVECPKCGKRFTVKLEVRAWTSEVVDVPKDEEDE
jgi:hypothetical protein